MQNHTDATQGIQPSGRPPAPGPLRLVQLFVNSYDVEDEIEALSDPKALRDWLADHGLLERRARVTKADVARAVEVREALRSLLLANNGEKVDRAAVRTLNEAASASPLFVRFDEEGRSRLAPAASDVRGALARLLAIVNDAAVEGTWERLKVCPEDTCRWAFYDHSKNRSGTWCSMAVCGNRAKARAYRRRHAAAS
jgi:predicted RNA-binding Zn ribbon-like protein